MIRTIKRFFIILFIFSCSVCGFAKSYKDYVKSDYWSTLEEKGLVRITHKNRDTELQLIPDCDYKDECLKNRTKKSDKLYPFISESIYLVNKKDILEKCNSEKTDIDSRDISRVVRSISKMEGMTYYSYTWKKTSVLYNKSYMIKSLDDLTRIPDQNEGNANGQVSYCFQDDHSFGECRYQLNYYESENTVYCVFKNIDSMGLGVFRAINPDDMRINIIAENCDDYIILYLEVEANCPNNSTIKKQMEVSLISRVEAIYNWFIVQF